MQSKQEIREAMLAKRGLLNSLEFAEAAERFKVAFLAQYEVAIPKRIAGYFPMRGELDVMPLLAALDAAGWQCALPVMPADKAERVLHFRKWQPQSVLARGQYGVFEPSAEAAAVTPEIILVPLLAYDSAGNRLGYGGGYYDATLAKLPIVESIGCGYAWQKVASVPQELHDQKLSRMIAVSS